MFHYSNNLLPPMFDNYSDTVDKKLLWNNIENSINRNSSYVFLPHITDFPDTYNYHINYIVCIIIVF